MARTPATRLKRARTILVMTVIPRQSVSRRAPDIGAPWSGVGNVRRIGSLPPSAKLMRDPVDELGHQLGGPRIPRRRPRCHTVGFRERREQAELLDRPDRGGHPMRGGRVVDVAAGRDVAKEQMVLDELGHGRHVVGRKPHPPTDAGGDQDSGLGVIAAGSLPDVMQERRHHQEVRSGDPGARTAAAAAVSADVGRR
jgi:hypothetical protein